jgi:hypothetical protein
MGLILKKISTARIRRYPKPHDRHPLSGFQIVKQTDTLTARVTAADGLPAAYNGLQEGFYGFWIFFIAGTSVAFSFDTFRNETDNCRVKA